MAVPRTILSEAPPETIIVRPPIDLSEALREELSGMRNVPGWISAAVTRRDGLAIQHTFGRGQEANALCAMAAAIVGRARSTGEELRQGAVHYSGRQYRDGLLLRLGAGPEG